MMDLSAESDEKPVESAITEPESTLPQPEAEKLTDKATPEPFPEAEAAHEKAAPVAEKQADKAPSEMLPEAKVTDSEAAPAAEVEVTIEPKSEEAQAQPKRQKRRKLPVGKRGKNQPTLRQVTARFAGCARCSYFWAGYRVIHGVAELETAVAHAHSGWLDLEWDTKMPELILKTYGVRMDIAHFHYEAVCKECRRRFIYDAAENEDGSREFCIEISPHTAK